MIQRLVQWRKLVCAIVGCRDVVHGRYLICERCDSMTKYGRWI
jgi:hypothetical protein